MSETTHPIATSSQPVSSDDTKPRIAWGTGNLAAFTGSTPKITGESAALEALHLLQKHNITHIDTAQRYGGGKAEIILGRALALFSSDNNKSPFTVDTKWGIPPDRAMTEDEITNTAHQSRTRINNDQLTNPVPIETFYLHLPTPLTPLPILLKAIDHLHKSNLFTNFGISNFSPAQVKEIHAFCTEHNYVTPSVYQGMYNAIHRSPETELFPLLKSLNISFRAYSPIAGGFLTKSRSDFEGAGPGRFSQGTSTSLYRDTYVNPTMLDALESWGSIAEQEGIGRAELAYRWVVFHSALGSEDGVILGARDLGQLGETVRWIEKGGLSARAVEGVEGLWAGIQREREGQGEIGGEA